MNERYYIRTKDGRIYTTEDPSSWRDAETLTRKAGREAYRAQAKADLLEFIRPGDTIYCILRHVSASGMSHRISCYIVNKGEIQDISGYVGEILEWRRNDKDGALIVGGCGMDMGFHTVYCLARALFRDEVENDAGYALKQRWL